MPHVLFAVPEIFENVAKPNTDGLYLFLLFNIGWEVGKFSEYKPRARKLYNDGNHSAGPNEPDQKHEKAVSMDDDA